MFKKSDNPFFIFFWKFSNSLILDKKNRDPDGLFSAVGFFLAPKIGALFLFERCSTSQMCAVKHSVQVGMLAFAVVHNASQHRGRSPYTLQSFFFLYDYDRGRANIFYNFSRIFSIYRRCQPWKGDGVLARGIGKLAFKWLLQTVHQCCHQAAPSSLNPFSIFLIVFINE